jgi:hypothetical protein
VELSREQILEADDLKIEEMEIPEWGGSIFVRVMTGAERNQFVKDILELEDNDDLAVRIKLCSIVVVDNLGKKLFTEDDIEALSGKSSKVLDRVYRKAEVLNCIEDAGVLEKNSETTRSEDSTSD